MDQSATILYSVSLNTLRSLTTGGADPSWDPDDEITVALDLSALPPGVGNRNIIASLQDGELAVVISDDTMVDYMQISLTNGLTPVEPIKAQLPLEFRLAQVGPSPGSGPVKIAFSLGHPAAVEINVFDIQGRKMASLARGLWPSGTHQVEWNGRMQSGELAAAGVYDVQYLYPGGQDHRAVVRVQ